MNVTISLPDELVLQARHRAVDRGVSLSRYVSQLVQEQLEKGQERRREARERRQQMMAKGFNLGMPDTPTWTRDELHER